MLLPDGFSPLARPAAAPPASFDMPLLGAVVELPVVVPLGEDPVAAPPVADPLPLENIAKYRKRASELVDKVNFDAGPST